MKTVQIYHGEFSSFNDLISEFGIPANQLRDCLMIYAEYGRSHYEGEAFVIFKRNNKIYEVNSSHCSCNGLQWIEEESSIESLLLRKISEDARFNLTHIDVLEKLLVFEN